MPSSLGQPQIGSRSPPKNTWTSTPRPRSTSLTRSETRIRRPLPRFYSESDFHYRFIKTLSHGKTVLQLIERHRPAKKRCSPKPKIVAGPIRLAIHASGLTTGYLFLFTSPTMTTVPTLLAKADGRMSPPATTLAEASPAAYLAMYARTSARPSLTTKIRADFQGFRLCHWPISPKSPPRMRCQCAAHAWLRAKTRIKRVPCRIGLPFPRLLILFTYGYSLLSFCSGSMQNPCPVGNCLPEFGWAEAMS